MSETSQTMQRLLTRCFAAQELQYLEQLPAFAQAVAEMKGLDDVEKVSAFGQRLLLARPAEIHAAHEDRTQAGPLPEAFAPHQSPRTVISIRSKQSGLYFKTRGDWTILPDQAHHFASVTEAEAFARELHDVEILVRRDGRPPMHLNVSLPPTQRASE